MKSVVCPHCGKQDIPVKDDDGRYLKCRQCDAIITDVRSFPDQPAERDYRYMTEKEKKKSEDP